LRPRYKLSNRSQWALRKILEDEGLAEPSAPSAGPVVRGGRVPVSFGQQRLWFLDQLFPGSAEYLVASVMRLSGALDCGVLERALGEIVARHEVLRTRLEVVDGEPVQVIEPAVGMELPLTDLGMLPGERAEAKMSELVAVECSRSFDLGAAPLLRGRLVRLSPGEHVLVVVVHHIVFDVWSAGVLRRELGVLYEAFSRGRPSPLEPLPIQYADFAVRQREWLAGEVLERYLAYWRQQLDGVAALALSADHVRPAVRSGRGAAHRFELSAGLSDSLGRLSRREGATLFMTLLATFKVLLFRYSGQEDIAVGTPIANRNRAEVEDLIGFFVNTLVLRTDLSGDPTFGSLLARVRETALGAYEHQDMPFERLVEELGPKRDLSQNPLFQVAFAFHDMTEPLKLPGIAVTPLEPGRHGSKFDLTMSLTEHGSGIRGLIEYSTDLFEPGTIRHMTGHFQTLLEAIVAEPGQRISQLPMPVGPKSPDNRIKERNGQITTQIWI
jgi:hypothetical protein